MMKSVVAVSSFALLVAFGACSSSTPSRNSGFDEGADDTADGGTGSDDQGNTGPTGQVFDKSDGSVSACGASAAKFDEPGNDCDDDIDGTVDNAPTCDSSLKGNGSAEDFAKSIGICSIVGAKSKNSWGLISAEYLGGYTTSAAPGSGQHGILAKFGDVITPQEGGRLGVLSSGWAQEFNGSSGTPFTSSKDWNEGGDVPKGYPKATGTCAVSNVTNDVINVKLKLKAPDNAKGFQFDFNFMSSEWPNFVCSDFNDSFIAVLSAKSFNGGVADNISFDSKNNPVSVNNGFFDRCTPNSKTGCADGAKAGTAACGAGASELAGTGFGLTSFGCENPLSFKQVTQGGATGWLTTQAPIEPGEEFELDFMIWDTGDQALDSSVLIDNFRWIAGEAKLGTDRVN